MSMVFWSLAYFLVFSALNNAFEVHFSGLHFYTLSQTLIACRAMQLGYSKSENIVKHCFKNNMYQQKIAICVRTLL